MSGMEMAMELQIERLCRICDQPEGTDDPILGDEVEQCPGCLRTVIDPEDPEYRRQAYRARRRAMSIAELMEENDAHVQ